MHAEKGHGARQEAAAGPKAGGGPRAVAGALRKPTRRHRIQIFEDIPKRGFAVTAIVSFLVMLAFWSILSYGNMVSRVFLPTPDRVLHTFFDLLGTQAYWHHIGISVFRVSAGFALACLLAIPIGLIAGTFRFAEAFVEPPMEFIRYMPAVAFIPLIMVWAGIGEWAKILLIFIGCFFQLVLMVASDTRQVSKDLVQASFTLGASRWQAVQTVVIPAVQPRLMNTMRLMLGWAWTYLVVAELVAVNSGLGYAIMKAQRFLNTDQIFVGIIVIGLLGLFSDRIFAFLNRRFFPWV
ncbi:ABC transporter permease [Cohnella nanjingensis]|uniref:ABC transporter permease n=2 Tax=Cohnella nanjingensis TaxID=1387779 RepID=A0A7X0RXF1_9BACL|nr:ABC transporter permease [Cohnella nanjingensis]